MVLHISRSAYALILAEAAAQHPQEACGLLFGNDERIDTARAVANVAASPDTTFEIDPRALFSAHKAERAGGPKLIGYWHSHPTGDPSPSITDREMAANDGRLWLITADNHLTAWRAMHGFQPLKWIVG